MRQIIDTIVQSQIPFLVIGGHALSVHGVQRDTADVDVLIAVARSGEMTDFLKNRGFEETSRHESFARFRHRSLVYPLVDVMEVDAATWSTLSGGSLEGTLFGHRINVPSVLHYIALKLHAIRQNRDRETKDLLDIVSVIKANPDKAHPDSLEALCARYAPDGFWSKLMDHLR